MNWTIAFILNSLPLVCVTLLLFALEYVNGQRNTDWRCNLQSWVLNRAISVAILPPVVMLWANQHWHLFNGAALPLWLGFAIFLLTRDFLEFAFHVAQHKVPVLWAMHSFHHTDPDMMCMTAKRHFWGDQFIKGMTIWPATFMVIDVTPQIVAIYGIIGLWDIFLHSGLRIDFGRWSWVLVSPEYHRRHHSRLREHYDSNYATMLPIYDIIFGSYHRPEGHPETGLDEMPKRFSDMVLWPLVRREREVGVQRNTT